MNNRYYLSLAILFAFVAIGFAYLYWVKSREPLPMPQPKLIYVDTFSDKKELIIQKQKETNNYYESTFYYHYRTNPISPELFNRAIQRHKYIDSIEAAARK